MKLAETQNITARFQGLALAIVFSRPVSSVCLQHRSKHPLPMLHQRTRLLAMRLVGGRRVGGYWTRVAVLYSNAASLPVCPLLLPCGAESAKNTLYYRYYGSLHICSIDSSFPARFQVFFCRWGRDAIRSSEFHGQN